LNVIVPETGPVVETSNVTTSTEPVLAISTTFAPNGILVPDTNIPGFIILASALVPNSNVKPLLALEPVSAY